MSETFALLSAASALTRRAPRTLAGGMAPAVWQRGLAHAAARLRTLERLSAWPLAYDSDADTALHAGSPFEGYMSELVARSQPAAQDGGGDARLPRRDLDPRTSTHASQTKKAARTNSPRSGSRRAEDFSAADGTGASRRPGVQGVDAGRRARAPVLPSRRPRTGAAAGVELHEARPSAPLTPRERVAARRAEPSGNTSGLSALAAGDAATHTPPATRSQDAVGRDTGLNVEGSRVALHSPDAGRDEPSAVAHDSQAPSARAAHQAGQAPFASHGLSASAVPDAGPSGKGDGHSQTSSAPVEEGRASTPFDDEGAQAPSRTASEVLGLPLEAATALLLRLGGAHAPSQRGNGFEPASQPRATQAPATQAPATATPTTQTPRADGPQVDGRRSRRVARRQPPSFTPEEAEARSLIGAELSREPHRAGADVPPHTSGKHDAPHILRHAVALKSTRAFDGPRVDRGAVRHAWLGGLVRRVERVFRRAGGAASSGVGLARSASDSAASRASVTPLYRDWSWSLEGRPAPPPLLFALAGHVRNEPDAGRNGHAGGPSSRTPPQAERPRTPAAASDAVTPAHAASSGAASRGNIEPPPPRNEHRQNVTPYVEEGARLLTGGEWTDFSLPQRIAPPALAPSLPTLIPPRAVDAPVLPVASETARLGARAEADAGEDDMEALAAKIKFILDEQARRHGIDV